jgi:hypothetical protein
MAKKSTHVVPNSRRGGWDIVRSGNSRSSGHFETKVDAIKKAIEWSKKSKAELYIHTRDGRIVQKNSYGHDPFPPRG